MRMRRRRIGAAILEVIEKGGQGEAERGLKKMHHDINVKFVKFMTRLKEKIICL